MSRLRDFFLKYVHPDAFSDVSPQIPLPVDGDSVYASGVDFANSDFTDWVGDTESLFQSP